MPQITLEYTANVPTIDFTPFLKTLHQYLAEHLPTELNSCKSRIVKIPHYYVGTGDANNAFVHLTIAVLKGREKSPLEAATQFALTQLAAVLQETMQQLQLQLTVALKELPDTYIKYVK